MLTLFSFADRRSKLGSVVLDVLLTEEIDLASEVTRYPVEDGTVISDHITQGVETVRISGLISTANVAAFSFSLAPGVVKLVDAIEKMRAMHKARAVVTISTGQMVYTDMAFSGLRAVRTSGDPGGNWLQIDAELIKVRKVTLKPASVPAAAAQAPASGRAGATNTPAGRASPTSSAATAAAASPATPAPVTPAFGLLQRFLR